MDTDAILDWLQGLLPQIENFAIGLTQPSRIQQIAALIAAFVLAHALARRLGPKLENWVRGLEDQPRARLRFLLVLIRRLRPILFVLLAWVMVMIIRAFSPWPSRSYLVALVAALATAWVFVGIMTRLIRNRIMRAIVAWGAWAFVTVRILGYEEDVTEVLDEAALDIGDIHLSLLVILQTLVTVTVLMVIARWLSGAASRRIQGVDDMSPSMKVLADKFTTLAIFATALILSLETVGFDLTNLAVLSGAIGLGIGFGLQKVVSNLVSGVILLMDKSIKPGDVISLGETFGWISALGARYVSVVTRDGREYLIPNEDLITGQVVNWSHSSDLVRLDVHFGVSYDSDPHAVRRIAREAAATVNRVAPEPKPVCHIVGFGDSSVDFVLRFWIHDPTGGLTNVRGDVYLALWDALKENGVDIPFPQRDVRIVERAPKDTSAD